MEQQPTPADILRFTDKWADEYIPKATESIKRNRHMNEVEEDVPIEKVQEVMGRFRKLYTAAWQLLPGIRKIDLLNHLTDVAKSAVSVFDTEVERAIVTDFINFVGVKLWVDYALYSRDLIDENWRNG